MRKLTLVLFALMSPLAFASPEISPPAAGHYAFQGSFTVPMKLHYEVVYAFTDSGAARLEKLRKEGQECWNKGRETWLCKAFQSTEGAADLIRARVVSQVGDSELVLGDLRGEPTLISKGTDVAEYEVPQTASYNGKTYETFRWMMSQGNWSVRLGDPTEAQFNVNNGALSMPISVSTTESKTEYSIYVVGVDFLRM